jgi:uncharacterized membrane protein
MKQCGKATVRMQASVTVEQRNLMVRTMQMIPSYNAAQQVTRPSERGRQRQKMHKSFSLLLHSYVCLRLLLAVIVVHRSLALVPPPKNNVLFVRQHDDRRQIVLHAVHAYSLLADISETDASLAAWTLAFSSTHIGMSAIRDLLIQAFGRAADSAKIVGNENWRLPEFLWPAAAGGEGAAGDEVGKYQIFPTAEIAGRQLYRAFYTMVSFITLGSALSAYLSSQSSTGTVVDIGLMFNDHPISTMTVIAANTASLSSLANASPLGLMPGFESTQGSRNENNTSKTGFLQLNRNDSLKFQVRGLTRITRHPLILPVVPWGIANAILLGGSLADWIFFGGKLLKRAIVGEFEILYEVRVIKGAYSTPITHFFALSLLAATHNTAQQQHQNHRFVTVRHLRLSSAGFACFKTRRIGRDNV